MLNLKVVLLFFSLLYYSIFLISLCACEKKYQLFVDHPRVVYFNKKYLENLTITCRRYSRKDPNRYVSVYVITARQFDNTYSIHFTFYELLSNVYKPTFVALRFDRYCDWLESDKYFGSTFVDAYLRSTPVEERLKILKCPIPPGKYRFENFTIPYTPAYKQFPFTNGRIVGNITHQNDHVATFSVDMVIK